MATPRPRRPTPRTLTADKLKPGSWTARWGDWVIQLRGGQPAWAAIVWRWTLGGGLSERTQLAAFEGFGSAMDATAWACDLLRENGAKVFVIDKPTLKLEQLLRFNPAPEVVP